MGTRGLYGIRKNGIDKTTYNHFDSYPSWLGANIVNFIKKHSIEELNEFYERIILVNASSIPTDEQKANCAKYGSVNLTVSKQSTDDWYCLLRYFQGDLEALYNVDVPYMIDDRDFIKDSLFCEYAYIINLDDNVLEFYEGFQHKPQVDNRYGTTASNGYYPCKLMAEIPLAEIQVTTNDIIAKYMTENDEE